MINAETMTVTATIPHRRLADVGRGAAGRPRRYVTNLADGTLTVLDIGG